MQNDIVKPPQNPAVNSDQPVVGQDVIPPSTEKNTESDTVHVNAAAPANVVAGQEVEQGQDQQNSQDAALPSTSQQQAPAQGPVAKDDNDDIKPVQKAEASAQSPERKNSAIVPIVLAIIVFISLSAVAIYSTM